MNSLASKIEPWVLQSMDENKPCILAIQMVDGGILMGKAEQATEKFLDISDGFRLIPTPTPNGVAIAVTSIVEESLFETPPQTIRLNMDLILYADKPSASLMSTYDDIMTKRKAAKSGLIMSGPVPNNVARKLQFSK